MVRNRCTRREFCLGTAALAAGGAFCARAAAPARESAGADAAAVRDLYETPDGRATDAVWCRRAYLDLAGRLPTAAEARAFQSQKDPQKRVQLVDGLIASEDFADYWSMHYADWLRVKSEFPINLWPNAVYVYHRRIRESIARDESWLAFAEALLTATGSNFRDPEVNFLRAAADRSPEGLSKAASQTFLGAASGQYADYFTRVAFKSTREWKEEIVYVQPGEGRVPGDLAARFSGDLNESFAAAHAARLATCLFVAPPAPAKRRALAAAFRAGDYRLKPFLKRLVLSEDYAKGPFAGGFKPRRIEAEVLADALRTLLGITPRYRSIAPEPFTFLPLRRKAVLIEDGSITSAFLILFGRPARDTGAEGERQDDVTPKERLYLFNSGEIAAAIARLVNDKAFRRRKVAQQFEALYWQFLARAPAAFERDRILARHRDRKLSGDARGRLPNDVAWCLMNTKEFLFRI